jgi:hypothetical protein
LLKRTTCIRSSCAHLQVAQLKDKLLAAVGVGSDGGDLGAVAVRVKALLSDRSSVPADSLDVLFRISGVGERLHAYCAGEVGLGGFKGPRQTGGCYGQNAAGAQNAPR